MWFCLCKGPSEEELFLREEDDICLERGRRRREGEGQRWEERLQENWENCLVRLHCVLKEMEWKRGDREPDYVTSALFSGVESVLPGLGRPFPAGEFPADPPPFDSRGEAPTG